MQPPAPSTNHNPPPGLPPVQPPSAGHIVQLFVVPLVIVLALFLLAYLVFNVTGGSVLKTPENFLHKLRDSNPDVRKRAANDLAQVLIRDDRLASEPAFALNLAEELKRAMADADAQETAPSDATLGGGENYLLYVLACISNLSVPVGVPELLSMAHDGGTGSPEARLTRRWRALWALAKLGDNLKRFDGLSEERRHLVLEGFSQEAAKEGDRAQRAAFTRSALENRQARRLDSLGVENVLIRASTDENPFLREIAVFAMNFWMGDDVANTRMDEALVARLEDQGQGEDLLAKHSDSNKEQDPTFTRQPGARIRYNAAIALAQRGSPKTSIDLLAEMLDEQGQLEQHRIRRRSDGREVADEATAQQTVMTALRATVELHRRNPTYNLTALQAPLEKLLTATHPALRAEAGRTKDALR